MVNNNKILIFLIRYDYDFRKPESAAIWKNTCLDMVKTGAIDSCFADGYWAVPNNMYHNTTVKSDFLDAKYSLLREV